MDNNSRIVTSLLQASFLTLLQYAAYQIHIYIIGIQNNLDRFKSIKLPSMSISLFTCR